MKTMVTQVELVVGDYMDNRDNLILTRADSTSMTITHSGTGEQIYINQDDVKGFCSELIKFAEMMEK